MLLLFAQGVNAQYSPQYTQVVSVPEPYGMTLTDYPALIIIDTQTPISAGQMDADGDDIRFSADCSFSQLFDYWIESGINTPETKIWVRIPQVSANDTAMIRMSYGDAAATATSSFNATFPNALITSGDTTVGGVQEVGWLHVAAGDTLWVTPGSALSIIAGYANIEGVIMAGGRGNQVTGLSTVGPGTGGGTYSTNSGSGGGSYGGVGGTGGQDGGDTPGTGGIVYGTQSGMDVDMGSGGGSSDNTLGGNGGGAVSIRSALLFISGVINADGGDAALPGGSRGGGGGSGGGILLVGDTVSFTGVLTASGGDGSVGTISANDSGGGGGGGRTKLFSDAGVTNTGTTSTAGGIGGPYGTTPAENGMPGTTHTGTWAFAEPAVGAPKTAMALYSEAMDTVCLQTSSFTLTQGTPSGGTYSGPGVTGNSFDPSAAGAGSHAIVYSVIDAFGCTLSDTSMIVVDVCAGISAVKSSVISVFPNPATDVLKITIEGQIQAFLQVKLVNSYGAVVFESAIHQNNKTVDLSSVAQGIYFVQISDGVSIIKNEKLVISK